MRDGLKVNSCLIVIFFIICILPSTLTQYLLMLILALVFFVLLLRLFAIFQHETRKRKLVAPVSPFISIIVTCANEPANLVAKTLDSMAQLDYSDYEVVVIDNNNQNADNWRQIEQKCRNLGSSFKFTHIDKIKGFKAGALNFALKYLDPRCEIIAIVDADYIVNTNFLKKMSGYFSDPKIGIVQAPQDYYDFKSNPGLYYDYLSFFSVLMNQAERFNAVTFTGTMGMIRRNLFDKELKWNEWCITEDTEAGLFIHTLGYSGVYLDESYGKGLMPLSYRSLVKQRTRWSYGNVQILKKDFWPILINKSLNWYQKISFLTQLFAWVHFELIIAIIFLASSVRYSLYGRETSVVIGKLSSVALAGSLLVYLLFYYFGLRRNTNVFNRMKGLIAHYGVLFSMSYSWIYCLLGGYLDFQVTEKQKIASDFIGRDIAKELIIPLLFLLGGILMLSSNQMTLIWFLPILFYIIIEILGVIYLYKKFKEPHEDRPTGTVMENSSPA